MDQKSHLRYRSLILAGVFIVFALAFLLFQYLHPGKKGAAAEISCSGQVTQVLDLSKNQEVTIQTPNGGTNQLIVKDGEIWCYDASCPDKLCVKQGKKHLDTDTIVCLPNQMIVTIMCCNFACISTFSSKSTYGDGEPTMLLVFKKMSWLNCN